MHLEEFLLFRMRRDRGRRRADRRVVGLQRLQRLALHCPAKEHPLQLIELFGDVVLAVEVALVEDVVEDFLGEDVLDQHLPHVGLPDGRVDRILRVGVELVGILSEILIVRVRGVDLVAQRVEHRRKVALELLDRLPEIGDLRPLIGEKQRQQAGQFLRILH